MLFNFIFYYGLSLFLSEFISESYGLILAILSGAYMVTQAIYDVNNEDNDD